MAAAGAAPVAACEAAAGAAILGAAAAAGPAPAQAGAGAGAGPAAPDAAGFDVPWDVLPGGLRDAEPEAEDRLMQVVEEQLQARPWPERVTFLDQGSKAMASWRARELEEAAEAFARRACSARGLGAWRLGARASSLRRRVGSRRARHAFLAWARMARDDGFRLRCEVSSLQEALRDRQDDGLRLRSEVSSLQEALRDRQVGTVVKAILAGGAAAAALCMTLRSLHRSFDAEVSEVRSELEDLRRFIGRELPKQEEALDAKARSLREEMDIVKEELKVYNRRELLELQQALSGAFRGQLQEHARECQEKFDRLSQRRKPRDAKTWLGFPWLLSRL